MTVVWISWQKTACESRKLNDRRWRGMTQHSFTMTSTATTRKKFFCATIFVQYRLRAAPYLLLTSKPLANVNRIHSGKLFSGSLLVQHDFSLAFETKWKQTRQYFISMVCTSNLFLGRRPRPVNCTAIPHIFKCVHTRIYIYMASNCFVFLV